jgi:DnaJ family protein A protein 2
MVKDNTLYSRLGVNADANESEIKKSYNTLSKKWHPDKNPDNKEESEAKFKEITEAKEILMDKEKREMYDKIGMDIFNNNNMANDEDVFSQFGNMFGGGFPFGMPNPGQRQNQPEHIVQELNVTLEQIYKEESIKFQYNYKCTCNSCIGEGVKNGKKSACPNCKGKGMTVMLRQVGPGMLQQSVVPCQPCNGKGKIINDSDRCDECKGETFNIKTTEIQIPLKSGLASGHKINLREKGHQLNGVKTDLILVIQEIPHKLFKRHSNDLFITIELKLYQALFGFEKMITHLDGRKLKLSHNSKTDFNIIRKISNEGMNDINTNKKGNLFIKFTINLPNISALPTNTKEQMKGLLQQFNKEEVQLESNITKNTECQKIQMVELKTSEIDNIHNLLNDIAKEKQNQQQTHIPQQFGQQSGQQCSQQ